MGVVVAKAKRTVFGGLEGKTDVIITPGSPANRQGEEEGEDGGDEEEGGYEGKYEGRPGVARPLNKGGGFDTVFVEDADVCSSAGNTTIQTRLSLVPSSSDEQSF